MRPVLNHQKFRQPTCKLILPLMICRAVSRHQRDSDTTSPTGPVMRLPV